jgi:hypothetical protein
MRTAAQVRAIGHKHPTGGQDHAPAPAINASAASHGEIWITLMHTTASAADTGQGRFVTSMARGGLTFDRLPAATHASIYGLAALMPSTSSRRNSLELNGSNLPLGSSTKPLSLKVIDASTRARPPRTVRK